MSPPVKLTRPTEQVGGWIGEIPASWGFGLLKRFCSVTLGKMIPQVGDSDAPSGSPYLRAAHVQPLGRLWLEDIKLMQFSQAEACRLTLAKGDVVVVEGGAGYGRAAFLKNDLEGWGFQNSINRVRTSASGDGRYVNYLFSGIQGAGVFETLINTSTIPHLTAEKLEVVAVPWPPLDEQRQIAEYLDRETGKIDELIAKQEQLVATLTERRHSFLDELVAKQTRGEGKGLTRVKNLYSVIDQRTGSPNLPLLSVSIHYGVRVRGEMTEDAPKSSDLSQYKVVRSNDIVINRMRAFQGALGCSPTAGVVSPDYLVLRPKGSVDPNWLALVFRSKGFVGEMTSRLRGIGSTESGMIRTPRINVDDLGGIEIRVPALSEQIDLVKKFTADFEMNSAISDAASRMIELLRERRAALISAAVTGKIDVRGL